MKAIQLLRRAIIILLIFAGKINLQAQCTEEPACLAGTTVDFEISYDPAVSNISWSVNAGGEIVGGQNRKIVNVKFPTAGFYTVSVYYLKNGAEKGGCWNIWARNPLSGGVISANNATVLKGDVLEYSRITNTTAGSGGIGEDRGYKTAYQWQESPDGITWTDVGGAVGIDCTGSSICEGRVYFRRRIWDFYETAYSNVVYVDVVPALNAGTVSSSQIITPGSAPAQFQGTAASGGANVYTYQWESSVNGINWTSIGGATGTGYQAPVLNETTYFRRKTVSDQLSGYSNVLQVIATDATTVNKPVSNNVTAVAPVVAVRDYSAVNTANLNKVTSFTLLRPGILTGSQLDGLTDQRDFQKTVSYLDGLGRPIESIAVNAGSNQKDLVGVNMYDQFGNQPVEHLSYLAATDNSNKGSFRTDVATRQPEYYNTLTNNQEGYFYRKTTPEESPLSRAVESADPGKSFAGNNVSRVVTTRTSLETDNVRIWSIGENDDDKPVSTGVYPTAALNVNIGTDEHNLKNYQYYDRQGRLVMMAEQADADNPANELRTYYVYAASGVLRYIITPLAVKYCATKNEWGFGNSDGEKALKELCYKYIYDSKGRVVSKWIPGAQMPDHIVYDSRSRPVLSQNARLKSRDEWMLRFYDGLDRIVMVALYKNPTATRESLQNMVDQTVANNVGITFNNPPATDLYLDRRDNSRIYEATQTITFVTGFESVSGDEFEAKINPAATARMETITVNNPVPGITGYDPQAIYYYDRYQWTEARPFDNSFKLEPGTNPYPVPVKASSQVFGKATGTKIKVSGKNQWLSTTVFYDEKGRIIQSQADNISGGVDMTTLQYDFSGNVLSYYQSIRNPRSTGSPLVRMQISYAYDVNGNVTQTNHTLFDNNTAVTKQLSTCTYDELGRLKTKQLSNLETLSFNYNLNGQLTGINSDYAKNKAAGNYFGMELFYETGFSRKSLKGTLAGVSWRRTGNPDEWHAYGYTYDNAGRFSRADYSQNTSGNWNNGTADYTSGVLQYDENGNIKKMRQLGMLTGNVKTTIDDLTYTNDNNEWSNTLKGVTDIQGDKHLGDFKNYNGRTGNDDYSYDVAGSLIKDKNRGITIVNNFLTGKPDKISIDKNPDQSIEYLYDVAGNTLSRTVKDGANSIEYTYISGLLYKNNELVYIPQPEGRIRKNASGSPVYDFFITDYLGNVRTVITDETSQLYYRASHEDNPQPVPAVPEREAFSFPENIDVIPPGHKFYNYNGVSNKKYVRLNSNEAGRKIGTGKVLRVMAGDMVEVGVLSWYQQNSPANNTPSSLPADIVNQLISALLGPASTVPNGKGNLLQSNASGLILNRDEFNTYVNNTQSENLPSAVPKAYLNYVLFDDNFKMVNGGVARVQQPNEVSPLTGQMNVTKNGFLYVYISNESPTDVFFDDLVVKHTTGHLLQEDSYYPFGLQMTGLSSRALNRPQNNLLFNGIEKTDEFDLGLYNAFYRTMDPQIGRWWQVDPENQQYYNLSPYNVNVNNPVNFADPLGNSVTDWFGRFGALIWKDSEASSMVINGQIFTNMGKDLIVKVGGYTYVYFGEKLISINGENMINSGHQFVEFVSKLGTSALSDLTRSIYNQKVNRESSFARGLTGNGVLSDETLDRFRKEANRESLSALKTAWAKELSGTDPASINYMINPFARANFLSTRALAATSNEEALGLISATAVDVATQWLFGMEGIRPRNFKPGLSFSTAEMPKVNNSIIVGDGGNYVTRMKYVRDIYEHETLSDIVQSAVDRTNGTGLEHAVVRLGPNSPFPGLKVMVSGGTHGIEFAPGEITTLFGHTHPTVTGASAADFRALQQLNQSKQYIFEGLTGEKLLIRKP